MNRFPRNYMCDFHGALSIGITLENKFLSLIILKTAFSEGFLVFNLSEKELMGGIGYKCWPIYLIVIPVRYGV
jgi:hypothetical protein